MSEVGDLEAHPHQEFPGVPHRASSPQKSSLHDMRRLHNLHAECWCRGEVANVRKLTLRLSAGVQELCVAPANF